MLNPITIAARAVPAAAGAAGVTAISPAVSAIIASAAAVGFLMWVSSKTGRRFRMNGKDRTVEIY
jgi:hypothetical protein